LEEISNERYWEQWFQHLLQAHEDNTLYQTQLLAIRDNLAKSASGLALYTGTPELIKSYHASEDRGPEARIQGIVKNLDSISRFFKRLDEKLVTRESYVDTGV
jgi:hypothetical protein